MNAVVCWELRLFGSWPFPLMERIYSPAQRRSPRSLRSWPCT